MNEERAIMEFWDCYAYAVQQYHDNPTNLNLRAAEAWYIAFKHVFLSDEPIYVTVH